MTTKYAIWTYYNGSIGVRIFTGTKKECKEYINQAIIKGAKKNSMKIEKINKYG